MTNIFESFKSEQDRLLTAYQRIPELGKEWLAAADTSNQQLAQWQTELSTNRFKLCVAGQMNSGKSTLINGLLFGRIVLPVLDTVMTSTITLIEHVSQNPSGIVGAKIEFYGKDEWVNLRLQMTSGEIYKEKFEATVAQAREAGVLATEIAGSAPRFLDGLASLGEYIAPMEKGGRYTPFVKQVTVYADNPLLKDLVVVDTPGINDPNQIRAKLTEDWMKQADAVLYVTYAGQALSAPDVEFINKFMVHVASSHRLVAVNKVDSVTDEGQLKSWLDNLRKSDSESLQMVFASSTPTIMVSALGGLLEKPVAPLDDDLTWYRDKLNKIGFLDPERHGLGKLKAAIESRLVENKGASLLAAHHAKIDGVCVLVDNAIRSQLESLKQKMLDSSKSRDALEKERNRLLDSNNEAEILRDRFRSDLDVNLQSVFRSLDKEIGDIRGRSADEVETKLAAKNSVKAVMLEGAWVAKAELEKACGKISECAEHEWNALHADLDRNLEGLKSDLAAIAGLSIETIGLIIDRASLIALGSVSLDQCGLGKDDLAVLAKDTQGGIKLFINEMFSASWGKDEVVAAFSHEIKEKIHVALKDRVKFAKNSISTSLDNFRSSIQTEIAKAIEMRTESINTILNQSKEMDGMIRQWLHEKDALEVELIRVTTLIKSLQ